MLAKIHYHSFLGPMLHSSLSVPDSSRLNLNIASTPTCQCYLGHHGILPLTQINTKLGKSTTISMRVWTLVVSSKSLRKCYNTSTNPPQPTIPPFITTGLHHSQRPSTLVEARLGLSPQQIILTVTVCKSLILCHFPLAHLVLPLVAVQKDSTKNPSASFMAVAEEYPGEIHLKAPLSRLPQSLVTFRIELDDALFLTSPQTRPKVHSPRAWIWPSSSETAIAIASRGVGVLAISEVSGVATVAWRYRRAAARAGRALSVRCILTLRR